jgi:polar amino acid transport system substrate-binding protein
MLRPLNRLCLVLALLVPPPATLARAPAPLTLLTEEYAPYNWTRQGGQLTGISTDIVNALMQRAGMPMKGPRVLPWARAMALTTLQDNTCVYTAARTPEREGQFQWVGPIASLEWVLFARTADKVHLPNLAAAKPLRIGTYIGNASVALLRTQGLTIEETSSDKYNPVKLNMRRIDLWAVGRVPGILLLRQNKISGIEPVYSISKTDMYLACNPELDPTVVAHLNKVLRDMYADHTIASIYASYGFAAETPALPD